MNKLVVFFTFITLIFSCQNPLESESSLDQGQTKPIDTMQADALVEGNITDAPQIEYPEFSIPWSDFMMMAYIAFSEN
jgi:hypothetical protein